jgi:fused signal recognition particle receptor
MFGFIKKSLNKTVDAIKVVAPKKKITFTKDEIEDILLEADVEYELVEIIINEIYQDKVTKDILRSKLLATLSQTSYKTPEYTAPFVELIVGVNGAGKTTTISKLAYLYKQDGKKVILGAGDTFRAAAIEQLTLWAEKLQIPIVSSKQGHDSSAVAYDTIDSAKSKGFDNVIIDTAGRLHTQTNLANELKKINRICDKSHNGSPHRTILIIDGTQGNSAIAQAKAFDEMIGIDGIIITKLDGTAKGGSVFSIAYALKLPILYVGTGEKPENLTPFDKYEFVDGLLDAIYQDEEPQDKQETQNEVVNEEPQEEIQEIIVDDIQEEVKEEKEIVEEVHEEIKEDDQDIALQTFLKDERLVFIKKISDTKLLVNYANTPIDTHIEYKDGKWEYSN